MVRALASALVMAVLAAACAMVPNTTFRVSPSTAPTSGATTSTATAAASLATTSAQRYLAIALSDVRTKEPFTLGGFAGKTVIVEGMAVW